MAVPVDRVEGCFSPVVPLVLLQQSLPDVWAPTSNGELSFQFVGHSALRQVQLGSIVGQSESPEVLVGVLQHVLFRQFIGITVELGWKGELGIGSFFYPGDL